MRFSACFLANAAICGPRITVPSSLTSSQIADRLERGEPAQIDRRLGMAGAHQHAAILGDQREDVAGPDEIGGAVIAVGEARTVAVRSSAEMPVVVPWR